MQDISIDPENDGEIDNNRINKKPELNGITELDEELEESTRNKKASYRVKE